MDVGCAWLAAADDSGEVQVASLDAWDAPRAAHRTLRRGHTNLASCVRLRPGRETEVVSAGADCRLVHWDAARLGQLGVHDLGAAEAASPAASSASACMHTCGGTMHAMICTYTSSACASTDQLLPRLLLADQMINPPMAHALLLTRQGDTAVVARGDGHVSTHRLGRAWAARRGPARRPGLTQASAGPTEAALLPEPHSAAATSLTWLGEDLIVSGGNDGRLMLRALGGAGPRLVHRHGPKLNALCSLGPAVVAAADTTATLTLYQVPA